MIPYGRQDITEDDIAAVEAVLRSDFLTQGPTVPRFESAVASRVGALHGVAVNSATSALHIACRALELGPGDVLWTSPITFVASANCALYCGADVDFVDIDSATYTMCPNRLEEKLAAAKRADRLPKVIVPVHLTGTPCDMSSIRSLSHSYGIAIIEDASHAIGAEDQGRPVGACAHSEITVFSFHPVKIITSAEGGMALTNDDVLAERMALLRSHGVTRNEQLMTRPSDGPWYYEQIALGWNYRMTDVQAALGLSQLARLETYVARRREIAARYDTELSGLPLRVPFRPEVSRSALHLYVIRLLDASRRHAVFDELRGKGIGVNVHYIPVHLQPVYRARGFREGDFPVAEDYYAEAISLPIYPRLSEDEQDMVIAALAETLSS